MLSFLRRLFGPPAPQAPVAPPPAEDVSAARHEANLAYRALTGEGQRLAGAILGELRPMLRDAAAGEVYEISPLAPEFSDARPNLLDAKAASSWLQAHWHDEPEARAILLMLETSGALDPDIDVATIARIEGDRNEYDLPDERAVCGGYVSHWDELSGELIVRPIVTWGGRRVDAQTERRALRILGQLGLDLRNSIHYLSPLESSSRAVPAAGRGGVFCPTCRWQPAPGAKAYFCPTCRVRLIRG